MPKININRKTGEIEIEGDCGAEWEGVCKTVKVTKGKIVLDCNTELTKECPDMRGDITTRAELKDHLSTKIMDYVRSMQWQVYNLEGTHLTIDRLKMALDEDTNMAVDYDLCDLILQEEGANYMIEYFDPEDPKGERTAIWYFLNIEDAKAHRADLMEVWGASKKDIGIVDLSIGEIRPGGKAQSIFIKSDMQDIVSRAPGEGRLKNFRGKDILKTWYSDNILHIDIYEKGESEEGDPIEKWIVLTKGAGVVNAKRVKTDEDETRVIKEFEKESPGGKAKTEYRWENIRFGQGHYYMAAKNEDAISKALRDAVDLSLHEDVLIVQQWKPKGIKYRLLPPKFENMTIEQIAKHYKSIGYDKKLILKALEGSTDVILSRWRYKYPGRGKNPFLKMEPGGKAPGGCDKCDMKKLKWIAASLANDEVSSDEELIEFFQKEGPMSKAEAKSYVAQRDKMLSNPAPTVGDLIMYKARTVGGSPGKFEYSGKIGEKLWEISLEGTDDELGCSEDYGWYGLLINTGIKGTPHAIVYTDVAGFIEYIDFDTEKEARQAWANLENNYQIWLDEQEDNT